jgi:hypothetical protein
MTLKLDPGLVDALVVVTCERSGEARPESGWAWPSAR